jgi:hypothetical protein
VYGIYAQACRVLKRYTESANFAEQARNILKSQFERVQHSYLLATAYMSLTFVSIAEDNVDNASFYLNLVRLFLTINTSNTYDPLRKLFEMASTAIQPNVQIEDILRKFAQNMLYLQKMYQEHVQDLGIETITKSPTPLTEYEVEQVMKLLLGILDSLVDVLETTVVQQRRLGTMLLSYGTILQIHERENRFDRSTRNAADAIASLTSTPYVIILC